MRKLVNRTIVGTKIESQQFFCLAFFKSTLQTQTKQRNHLKVLDWPFNNAGKRFNY